MSEQDYQTPSVTVIEIAVEGKMMLPGSNEGGKGNPFDGEEG